MGATPVPDPLSSAYASSLIKFKAKQLARKRVLRGMDCEDIAQELTVRLLAKIHLYDPERGASFDTFANRVITTAIASMLREQKRKKRAGEARTVSLDRPAKGGDENAATLGDQLSAADRVRHTNAIEDDQSEEFVAEVATWPEAERRLFLDLLESNIAAEARARGITRQRVYRQTERMRKRFEDADLEP